MLVVAVVLLGARRVLTHLRAALSPSESSVGPQSVLRLSSRVYTCLAPLQRLQVCKIALIMPISMYSAY